MKLFISPNIIKLILYYQIKLTANVDIRSYKIRYRFLLKTRY